MLRSGLMPDQMRGVSPLEPGVSRSPHSRTGSLHGRTLDAAIGTEDAAVAGQGPEQPLAGSAFVEINARVGGHGFGPGVAADRAGDHG